MRKRLLVATLLLAFIPAFGQQGDGGKPRSYKVVQADKTIDHRVFSTPDIAALRAEDAINDDAGTGPWRFGFNNYTALNMENAGTWTTLPNGDRVWRLVLTCDGALTVNLTMDQVQIPEGNELYVYNPEKDFILGKFTDYHTYQGKLGTELVPGNTAIVEYYIPVRNSGLPAGLNINTVTHGYRTAGEYIEKAFGSSGSCNMNVNCPDGAAWVNQRNSAVMLVSGSSGFCSGALVNNTLNDGKPYVLTANHCYSDPTTWIFRFNWQATSCTNPGSSPTFQSLSGAVLRARRTPSDFCLVEITGGLVGGTVPSSYSPYFSGWDNSGTIPTATVCIHHPSGDIKKISFDDAAPAISQGMGSTEANSTWTIEWDRNTTTEGGSSGSPLFDQNHRIIGQLWGGGASCSALSSPDYYGRFSSSWNPSGSNSTNQLKFWLDPNNAGAIFIDGYDPSGATAAALDAGLSSPTGVTGTFCTGTITPQITITNSGTTTLTAATITYGFDGTQNLNYNWSGSLAQWQTAVVTLPSATLSGGAHTFAASVTAPNGGTDENGLNDQITSSFNVVVNGQTVSLALNLDCWGTETSWELRDGSNTLLYSGSGYSDDNPTTVNQDFCLTYGCYDFKIMDSYGDGLEGTFCNNSADDGAGSYQITYNSAVMAEITAANANFGSSNTQNFCITAGIDEKGLDQQIQVYPNPATDQLTVIANEVEIQKVELLNVAGQVVSKYSVGGFVGVLDVRQITAGVYFVKVNTPDGDLIRQVVIR